MTLPQTPHLSGFAMVLAVPVAIILGGTAIGPIINLSLVAVVVYELTLYKPPPAPKAS